MILDYSITVPDQISVDESICIVGDSRQVISRLPNGFANLIFIDPPYGDVVDEAWDSIEYLRQLFNSDFVESLCGKLASDASMYICCGEGERSDSYSFFKSTFSDYLLFKDHITITKERGNGNRRGWLYTREEMIWWNKGKKHVWNEDAQYSTERRKRDGNGPIKPGQDGKERKSPFKRLTNVWNDISFMSPDVVGRQKYHPTPKPLKLVERVILAHTKPGDIVLDCFGGVMTTWEACRRLGRRCVSIELDRKNVENGLAFFADKSLQGVLF